MVWLPMVNSKNSRWRNVSWLFTRSVLVKSKRDGIKKMCYFSQSPICLLWIPFTLMLLSFFLSLKALFFVCSLFLPFLISYISYFFSLSLSRTSGLVFDEIFSSLSLSLSSVHEISPNTYTCLNDAWPLAQSINGPIEFSHIPYLLLLLLTTTTTTNFNWILPVVTLCRDYSWSLSLHFYQWCIYIYI